MRFHSVPLTALVVGLWPVAAFGQRTREQYEQERESLVYVDRFDNARTALSDTNQEVAVQAFRDLLDTAKQLEKNQEAIAALDQYLTQVPEDSSLHHHAFYIRARLLHRIPEQNETAVALFKQGIANGWKPLDRATGFWAYKDSLWENDPVLYAVEVFNDLIADATGEAYLKRGDHMVSLGVDLLWPLKKRGQATVSATTEILPKLTKSEEALAHHTKVAEALCMMIDARYDEAVDVLVELSSSLQGMPENYDPTSASARDAFLYNEKLNIPLYLAAVRVLEGNHLDQASVYMREFLTLNANRPHYVSRKLMTLVYALERAGLEEQRRMTQVTQFLIESGLHTDPRLPKDHILHLLDMHMGGYFRQQNWEPAKSFALQVVAQYDPKSDACNNSLFALGCIHALEGKPTEAEEVFVRLLSDSSSPKWKRVAQSQLAALWMSEKKPPEEIEPLVDGLEGSAPDEAGFYQYDSTMDSFRTYSALYVGTTK